MTAQQVFRQQEMDHQLQVIEGVMWKYELTWNSFQTWRMEAAHAHLRTLDWVLHQEPYAGSDAQDSVDREEEMIRRRGEMEPMEEDLELVVRMLLTVKIILKELKGYLRTKYLLLQLTIPLRIMKIFYFHHLMMQREHCNF